MNAWRDLRRRWAQASLEYDLDHGRRAYGRSSTDDGGPRITAEMPVQATIEARVIRADGAVEELGVVATTTTTMTRAQLAQLDAIARRRDRRGKR